MRIATFNVNGIRSRLRNLLEWLQREAPDVVCLQELKAPDSAFPVSEIGAAGYQAIWHGQKAWNGVAILARGTNPIETRRGLPERYESACRYPPRAERERPAAVRHLTGTAAREAAGWAKWRPTK